MMWALFLTSILIFDLGFVSAQQDEVDYLLRWKKTQIMLDTSFRILEYNLQLKQRYSSSVGLKSYSRTLKTCHKISLHSLSDHASSENPSFLSHIFPLELMPGNYKRKRVCVLDMYEGNPRFRMSIMWKSRYLFLAILKTLKVAFL